MLSAVTSAVTPLTAAKPFIFKRIIYNAVKKKGVGVFKNKQPFESPLPIYQKSDGVERKAFTGLSFTAVKTLTAFMTAVGNKKEKLNEQQN